MLSNNTTNCSVDYLSYEKIHNGTFCSSQTSTETPAGTEGLQPTDETIFYIAYVLAIILGTTGNIVSIIVFARGQRCKTDIRKFLINLAVADLMMAIICLPFSFSSALIKVWIWSAPMCPIIMFLQHVSVTVSVYTNTAISIDRFIAIKYPLVSLKYNHTRTMVVTICLIWTVSVGLSSIQLWLMKVQDNRESQPVCQEVWPIEYANLKKLYSIVIFAITYVIPVLLIMVMYGLVCAQLWFRMVPGSENNPRDAKQLKTKKKVVKMLITMISLFTICWMPLHIFFLLVDFQPQIFESISNRLASILYFSAHWLAMSNSFQNPIIYGFLNENFRSDLAGMLVKCCPILTSVHSIQQAACSTRGMVSRANTKSSLLHTQDSRRNMYYRDRKYSLITLNDNSSPSGRKMSNISTTSIIEEKEELIPNNYNNNSRANFLSVIMDEAEDDTSVAGSMKTVESVES